MIRNIMELCYIDKYRIYIKISIDNMCTWWIDSKVLIHTVFVSDVVSPRIPHAFIVLHKTSARTQDCFLLSANSRTETDTVV